MTFIDTPLALIRGVFRRLDEIPYSLVILPARIATFSVFFRSGLVKIADWDATLTLFREEYKVPLLPPEFAAHMAATMELGLSSLVLIGLCTRFSVLGLIGMVAVIQLFVEPMGWLRPHSVAGLHAVHSVARPRHLFAGSPARTKAARAFARLITARRQA